MQTDYGLSITPHPSEEKQKKKRGGEKKARWIMCPYMQGIHEPKSTDIYDSVKLDDYPLSPCNNLLKTGFASV